MTNFVLYSTIIGVVFGVHNSYILHFIKKPLLVYLYVTMDHSLIESLPGIRLL